GADGSAQISNEMHDFHEYGKPGGTGDSVLKYSQTTLGLTRNVSKPPSKMGGRKFVDPEAMWRVSTLLPSKPVSLGESWTNAVPNPFVGGGLVTVRGTMFREELVGATNTVRIHQTLALPISVDMSPPGSTKFVKIKGTLKINTASNFDPAGGKLLR